MRLLLIALLLVSLTGVVFAADPQSGESVDWQVIANGGQTFGASSNFRMGHTLGQAATGAGTSENFILREGFWVGTGTLTPDYLCGDANNDELANVTDAVYLIQYIFSNGPAPVPPEAGDTNCDALANITDAVYLIQYIFNQGPAPCANCP